jgi:hypothetical protein
MKNNFTFLIISAAFTLLAVSCKKSSSVAPAPIVPLKTLGLYQYGAGNNRRVFIPVTKVGTQSVTYYTVFDTGSAGLTLDANGLLPASMITSTGIVFTGDSIDVNGITGNVEAIGY